MPVVVGRHSFDCRCCAVAGTPAQQSLAEVAFGRSAAAAAQCGDLFRVKSLVERSPVALEDDGYGGGSGYTPLLYAARGGHLDVVELLLRLGARPDAATTAGRATPLQRAAYAGHGGVVAALLRGGATPGLQDADGQTALHKAAQQGHIDVAAALLAACPQLAAVKDARGLLASDLAPSLDAAPR